MRSSADYGYVGKTDGGNDVIKLAVCTKKDGWRVSSNKRYGSR
jgi:hypothetical protein